MSEPNAIFGDIGATPDATEMIRKAGEACPPETCWKSRPIDGTPRTRFTRVKSALGVAGIYVPDIALHAETKVLPAGNDGERLKMLDDKGRLNIRSLISTPDIDTQDERVRWDAFVDTIGQFAERPRMLAYHDMRQPIGNWPEQRIDRNGTMLQGFVSSGRPDIQQFVLDDMLDSSVGFIVLEVDYDSELDVLDIVKARLIEGSLVPLPANEGVYVEALSRNVREWAKTEAHDERAQKSPTPPPAEENVVRKSAPLLTLSDLAPAALSAARAGSVAARGMGSILSALD